MALGKLYVVATPIGNLEDITIRALRILRYVDYIAAEDTRHTSILLKNFSISKPLISVHEFNEHNRLNLIKSLLTQGYNIALVSDAGTPLISDPGFRLVGIVRHIGVSVIPVPGPSSLIAALSVSGLPTRRFIFEGFLSNKSNERRKRLEYLAKDERTLIFFESSHRIVETVQDLALIMGTNRIAVIARELTKLFEEIYSARLIDLITWLGNDQNRLKGEYVILVNGNDNIIPKYEELLLNNQSLLNTLLEELPMSKAVAVAVKITGLKKNYLYKQALSIKYRN